MEERKTILGDVASFWDLFDAVCWERTIVTPGQGSHTPWPRDFVFLSLPGLTFVQDRYANGVYKENSLTLACKPKASTEQVAHDCGCLIDKPYPTSYEIIKWARNAENPNDRWLVIGRAFGDAWIAHLTQDPVEAIVHALVAPTRGKPVSKF